MIKQSAERYWQDSTDKGGGRNMYPFCIYGAGIVAVSIYTALKTTYNCIPSAFLISERGANPLEIDGIPVKILTEWSTSNKEMMYLIAVPESHHAVIAGLLFEHKIDSEQIIFVGNKLENKIMGDFYSEMPLFMTVQQMLAIKKPVIEVFQAKSHVDHTLQNPINIPNYVCPIQVGAELTDQLILDRRDNEGDNISLKNKNYCELTATYYAWKHSSADYKGICHYRRIFDISDQQIQRLIEKKSKWDVVLPYPSIHYPNISGQHSRYINESDWEAMCCALKETAPAYYEKFREIFSGPYFYNYNMLIARKEVYDDYCSFIFSVLERTEELTFPKGWERADRFAGYLGENLTTLYFMANRDKLKMVHAGKIWLT